MSEETPDTQAPETPKKAVLFRTSTFGGYQREEVDAYLDEVARASQRDKDELSLLRQRVTELEGRIIGNIPAETEAQRLEEENARLRAQLEAVTQDDAVRLGQANSDVEILREQLRVQRDELERTQIERAKISEELDALRSERDSFQRLAERLSGEEQQAKELLLAATKAAEELRVKARRDADELSKRTEESVAKMEDEARMRVDNLRKEYERVRSEYDAFLLQAREVAQNLVRKMDDARAKWPL